MTPMEKAVEVYTDHAPLKWMSREALEAACLAYVRALSEDEGTVEAMAESFRAAPSMSYEDAARYFLRTLATKEPT